MAIVKVRDERYLFGVSPWLFLPVWLCVAIALEAALANAPTWIRLVVLAPVGWVMVWYVVMLPRFQRRGDVEGA